MKKLITTSLAPNAHSGHTAKALSFLVNPLKWLKIKKGDSIKKLEQKLTEYIPGTHAITFNSGRTALYAALQAIGVKEGDEVIVQAYTCISVPNAILAAKAMPVYVDINDQYNIDVAKLEKKITSKTKVIITQNTFGNPADIIAIKKIAKSHNVAIIEDIAHALGAEYDGRKLGTFGDIAIASFGRDKVITGVIGGAALTQKQNYKEKLESFQDQLPHMGLLSIKQHLLYPMWATCIKKTYYFLYLGKIINVLAKKTHLLPKVIDSGERCGKVDVRSFKKIPNACAELVLQQLNMIEQIHNDRIQKAILYNEILIDDKIKPRYNNQNRHIFLRYAVQINNPEKLILKAKKRGIYLGNWYDAVIAPKNTNPESVGYHMGESPVAEEYASKTVNLPNHFSVTKEEISLIAEMVNDHVRN